MKRKDKRIIEKEASELKYHRKQFIGQKTFVIEHTIADSYRWKNRFIFEDCGVGDVEPSHTIF